MSKIKIIILSMTALIITASLYAAQPILPELAADFHSSLSRIGLLMTVTLLGNAIAQLTVIPLADKYEKRGLAQLFLLMGVFANLLMACSTTMGAASLAGVLIGFYSCSNMLLLSFAGSVAESDCKGRVTAAIMGGVLSGILLSRLFSGIITELYSWRVIYGLIALCLLAAFFLLFLFPKSRVEANHKIQYIHLLKSMKNLVWRDKTLKRRMFSGMSSFLVFNFLWTGLTYLLTEQPFSFDSLTIGLFGLAGVSGILASKLAGRLFDRGLGAKILLYAWMVLGASWAVLLIGAMVSSLSIVGSAVLLVVGIVMLDAAMQMQHITNQSFILSFYSREQSRALTAYMCCNLLMGSVSNLILSLFYERVKWTGICLISIAVCIVNVITVQTAASSSPNHPVKKHI